MKKNKPIYERAVWKVFINIANEIKLARKHCPIIDEGCIRHLKQAEEVATKYVLDDMKRARKCQRR